MTFTERVLSAVRLAVKAHDGQRRKGNDEPYVSHPLRVAQIIATLPLPAGVSREHCVLAAILHDVLEDSKVVTRDDLKRGFGREVMGIVIELTQDKSITDKAQRRREMLEHCGSMSAPAKIVKLADRLDNMREMEGLGPEFIRRYCEEGRILLKNMHGTAPDLELEIARLIEIHS